MATSSPPRHQEPLAMATENRILKDQLKGRLML
jgi:hypothetical protein